MSTGGGGSGTGGGGGMSGEVIPVSPTLTGLGGGSETLCQKYSTQIFGYDNSTSEQEFITEVVVRAVLGNSSFTTPSVPGLFAANSPTVDFFSGKVNFTNQTRNYTQSYLQDGFNSTGLFAQLATKLVSYFGYGFGCVAPGFPSYHGNPNMTLVHKGMHITWNQMQYFDQQIALSLSSFGVTPQDVQQVAIPYLYDFNRYPSLHDGNVFPNGSYGAGQMSGYPITEDEICSDTTCPVAPPAYSFCEKYTAAIYGTVNSTNEVSLITTLLSRAMLGGNGNGQTVVGILNPSSPLVPFLQLIDPISFGCSGLYHFVQSTWFRYKF